MPRCQNTHRSLPARTSYPELSPFERVAAHVAGRRMRGPVTERMRALRAAEEAEPRALEPEDIPELEAASPSQFVRMVLRAAGASSTRRGSGAPPHVERLVHEELVAPGGKPRPYREALADCSAKIVEDAIRWAGGNKAHAAKQLGISRVGLYKAMWRTGIES